ncbi:hypothetical protein MHN80_00160 [Gordonia McavH-238-E]|uniref:hypothetical protein n=1 Tax=Gordonia sp. McavH-238-E TaxID=2917736 RepID=UPI001EF73F34|nr:hypothetical protein [Gordonia sp. McavH-238-E]MCG7630717.1 hypothetical protein [Gordonia sp. McavH-238-E]
MALFIAGCGVTPSPSEQTTTSSSVVPAGKRLPPDLDISFRWIPTDILDLSSAEATFVRAYTESFELAFEGQSMEWGYPGFAAASPPGTDERIRLVASNSLTSRVVNTLFMRPLRREDAGDRSRFTLCRSELLSIEQRSDSGVEWRNIGKRWAYPITIEFIRTGERLPPADRHGHQITPSTPVFGSWQVSFFDRLGMGPENRADHIACNALPPNPDLPRVGVETGPEPWPVLPPTPGWPANGL